MRSKFLRSVRALIVAGFYVFAISGSLGVGIQVCAIAVFLTAYRKPLADRLDELLAHDDAQAAPQTEEGRSATAFHEAGHAVVGWVLPGARKPKRASIVPNAEENGRVETEERSGDPHDLDAALDEMASWLAGYLAEEEFGRRSNAGCCEDLEHATSLARQMVCEWGFSGKLPRRHYDPASGLLTEELRATINAEIDRFLQLGEERARKAVKGHRDTIGCVAGLLLQHRTLDQARLKAAIEKTP